jgi:hypothetical protein
MVRLVDFILSGMMVTLLGRILSMSLRMTMSLKGAGRRMKRRMMKEFGELLMTKN